MAEAKSPQASSLKKFDDDWEGCCEVEGIPTGGLDGGGGAEMLEDPSRSPKRSTLELAPLLKDVLLGMGLALPSEGD